MYPSRIAEYTVAKTDQTCFNAMILSNKDVLNITDRPHFLKIIENTSMNPKCFISTGWKKSMLPIVNSKYF